MDVRMFGRLRGASSVAVLMSFLMGTSAWAQNYNEDGQVQQVGFFKKRSCPSCSSCETCPTCPCPSMMPAPSTAPSPEAPQQPEQPQQPDQQMPQDFQPQTDVGSSTAAASSPQSLAPNMLGDSLGIQDTSFRATQRFKIADNTNILPQTRIYYAYHYFKDAFQGGGDLHRNIGGGEFAFLNGLASFEIRQGLNSFSDFGASNGTTASNLFTNLKGLAVRSDDYAVSGGLAVGWPTGPKAQGVPAGNYTFFPYFGYVLAPQAANWFVQGFQQWDIPTAGYDQPLMQSDVAAGYYLIKNREGRLITGLAPTAELHLYTPFGKPSSLVNYDDVLNGTFGGTVFLGRAGSIGMGVGVPLSNVKQYDVEFQVFCNLFNPFGLGR